MSETSPESVATAERPGATAPIDIAPQRRPGWNRVRRVVQSGADWLHLTFASAVVLGVFLQVYLIGAYIFGAGQGALDAHRTAGFALQGPELFVLLTALIAWLPRIDLLLSFLVAIIGFVQAGLAKRPPMGRRPPPTTRPRRAEPCRGARAPRAAPPPPTCRVNAYSETPASPAAPHPLVGLVVLAMSSLASAFCHLSSILTTGWEHLGDRF